MIIELPEDVKNKIAAGEVIERPLNVIKELVENSIDAGATKITIELEQESFNKIIVRDNGIGMDEHDISLCALPHTTSKLQDEQSLYSIKTLGFRGEALASIAHVSELTIRSRHKDAVSGYEVKLKDGKVISKSEFGMPQGTEVIVQNLFYNLPVRKKSLSEHTGEIYQIYRLIDSFAILYSNVKFFVLSSGKLIKEYFGATIDDRIREVWGPGIFDNLVHAEAFSGSYYVSAFFSKPGFTMKSASHQLIFVNNRLVRSYEIETKVKQLYKDMLFLDTNPLFVFCFTVPFEEVDVNIHPGKKTVKFLYPEKIMALLESAFNSILADKSKNIGVSSQVMPLGRKGKSNLPSLPKQVSQLEVVSKQAPESASPRHAKLEQEEFRVLGQLNKTYIVVEQKDGFFLVDQHAAEERVFFEQVKKSKTVKSVSLVMPVVLHLTLAEVQWLKSNMKQLLLLGFQVEEFGKDSFILRALPDYLRYYEGMFKDMISEVGELDVSAPEEVLRNKLATFACRRAVKANQELTEVQLKDLVSRLFSCDNPFTCPHGRPTVLRYSWGDIEKAFRRKQ